jgi:hypothetical protein
VTPGRERWRTAAGADPPGAPWEAVNGDSRTQVLRLRPGRWDISLRWFSEVPLRLSAGSVHTTLPAYTAEESQFASALRVHSDGAPLTVRVNVPARRRLATQRTVRLGTLAATRVDERGRLVPVRRACGRYVDWYRLGRE